MGKNHWKQSLFFQDDESLEDYLCRQRALKSSTDRKCLNEYSSKKTKSKKVSNKKKKGDSASSNIRDNSDLWFLSEINLDEEILISENW